MTAATTKRPPPAPPPKPRRTQEERRGGTIRKLLDAATATLVDVGYAEASVQAICARAGVSQGALFRHFPTREALMVAVGEDVGRRMLTSYQNEFEALRGSAEPLVLALRLVRAHARSRVNQAWYELALAARTHGTLREALAPAAIAYYREIEALARQLLPDVAARMGDRFGLFVETMLAIFDGENVHRFVLPSDASDDARLALLVAFTNAAAQQS
jgi:AcrR family transcriptional regulator